MSNPGHCFVSHYTGPGFLNYGGVVMRHYKYTITLTHRMYPRKISDRLADVFGYDFVSVQDLKPPKEGHIYGDTYYAWKDNVKEKEAT